MTDNRKAAERSLKAVLLAGLVEPSDAEAAKHAASAGIIAALLDVADAIREQAAALTGDDKRAILIERNQ
jgi:hypothetical protein